jgi:hypothetical protein
MPVLAPEGAAQKGFVVLTWPLSFFDDEKMSRSTMEGGDVVY